MEPDGARGTVAVLGASGFIGRHVAAALAADGWSVRAIARSATAAPGVQAVPLDLLSAPAAGLADALRGCAAVVNAVGIKRERGPQTFQAVHVDLVRKLAEACRLAGVRRVVHVSVVAAREDGPHAYHRTKWQAERLLRGSGLDWTLLRPSVVYGRGDDLLGHLSKMVRASPVFPIVGSGQAPMQPVDVEDVALAAARALARPASIGGSYDLVGPERLPLRGVVQRVAEAMGDRVRIWPTPPALMRLPVAAMAAFAEQPLSTPAQLRMLEEGLAGDGAPAARDLGLHARPFSLERIRALLPPAPRAPAVDLRLGRPGGPRIGLGLVALAALLGIAAMTAAFTLAWADLWIRLVAGLTAVGVLAWLLARPALVDAWRPSAWTTLLGVGTGLASYVLSWGVTRIPAFGSGIEAVYAFQSGHSQPFITLTLLPAIVAEEILWRGVVVGGLGARMPRWTAVVLGAVLYSAAHLASGSPFLMLAALGFGLAWGLLFVVTRSLWAVIVSHAVWELLSAVWLRLHP